MTTYYFKHYSLVPKALWKWANFTPKEIACRKTGAILINTVALDALQAFRNKIGKAIIVNSAYRSPEHNKEVGGVDESQHLLGAFDIRIVGHNKFYLLKSAFEVGFTGIGLYETWLHLDVRKTPALWGKW